MLAFAVLVISMVIVFIVMMSIGSMVRTRMSAIVSGLVVRFVTSFFFHAFSVAVVAMRIVVSRTMVVSMMMSSV